MTRISIHDGLRLSERQRGEPEYETQRNRERFTERQLHNFASSKNGVFKHGCFGLSIRENPVAQWHYIRYIDDSEELYDLDADPEEWTNLASDPRFARAKAELAASIPEDPIDLPEESLLELQEHHVPPFRNKAYFFSPERAEWMKRFE